MLRWLFRKKRWAQIETAARLAFAAAEGLGRMLGARGDKKLDEYLSVIEKLTANVGIALKPKELERVRELAALWSLAEKASFERSMAELMRAVDSLEKTFDRVH